MGEFFILLVLVVVQIRFCLKNNYFYSKVFPLSTSAKMWPWMMIKEVNSFFSFFFQRDTSLITLEILTTNQEVSWLNCSLHKNYMIPLFFPCPLSLSLKRYLIKAIRDINYSQPGKVWANNPAITHWQPRKWLAMNKHIALNLVLLMCLLIHLQFHAQF